MNWRRVLKSYRCDALVVQLQTGDGSQPVPQRQHLVECRAILGLLKPFDEPNAIAIGDVVCAQPREPLGRFVALVLLSLYGRVRHVHFVRTPELPTPYLV